MVSNYTSLNLSLLHVLQISRLLAQTVQSCLTKCFDIFIVRRSVALMKNTSSTVLLRDGCFDDLWSINHNIPVFTDAAILKPNHSMLFLLSPTAWQCCKGVTFNWKLFQKPQPICRYACACECVCLVFTWSCHSPPVSKGLAPSKHLCESVQRQA